MAARTLIACGYNSGRRFRNVVAIRSGPDGIHTFFPLWMKNDSMPALFKDGGDLGDRENGDTLWACGQMDLGEIWPFRH